MNEIQSVTEVAKGISDFGALVILASSFIVLSLLMWVALFRWFKGIIDTTIKDNARVMNDLLKQTEAQNDMLNDIADGLRPTTLLQIKSISNTCFDLSVEKVCRIIKKVREENHIVDKEATVKKIRTLIINLHENRNSRFDNTRYHGKSLSFYTSVEWIDWVAEVVEKEVYDGVPNNERAFTNVNAVYDRIKLDFYHNLTKQ